MSLHGFLSTAVGCSVVVKYVGMFDLDLEETGKKLLTFIKNACKKEGYKDVLIAVSGGIDSSVSITLAVKALGKKHVYPVLLPYGNLNDEGTRDAMIVINGLKIPNEQITKINIKPFVDSIVAYDKLMDEGRIGNIMARVRTIILYDLSKKLQHLVIGTENKTEHLLGYYTRFGDEASDIEPLRNLYKAQVYGLAKYLRIPKKIITKKPSAGLWEGQTDEGEFGFSYKEADEILYLHTEKNLSKAEIIKKGYDKKTVERLWWWLEKGEFKNRLPHVFNS